MDISYGLFDFARSGIPTPRVTISYKTRDTSAGRQIGTEVDISLKGQVYGTGQVSLIKASGMIYMFMYDYQPLRIKCESEQVFPPVGTRQEDIDKSIHVKNINFTNSSDERMHYAVDYDISLGATIRDTQRYLFEQEIDGPVYLRSLSDDWSVQEVKDKSTYLVDVPKDTPESAEKFYPGSNYDNGHLPNNYYNISRTIRAEGIAQKDSPRLETPAFPSAFKNAKKGINLLLNKAPGLFNNDDVLGAAPADNTLNIYNRVTSYDADVLNGSLTYTETYVAFSGAVTSEFTHDFDISNTLNKDFDRTVTINGRIQGYDIESNLPSDYKDAGNYMISTDGGEGEFVKTRQNVNTAYIRASGGLSEQLKHLYGKARHTIGFPSGEYVDKHDESQSYDDFKLYQDELNHDPKTERLYWLNPTPVSFNADHDVNNGSITYSCTFNNRPFSMVPGALNETLSVRDNYAVTGYANQNIMYRGAFSQHLGTISTPSRTVSYNATFDSTVDDAGKEVNNEIILTEDSYIGQELSNAMDVFNPVYMDPNFNNPDQATISSWITDDNFEINFIEGTLNKTMTWNYTIWKG